MSDLHFQHPERVHLLWAVLAWLAVWWALHRRGRDVLARFVGSALHDRLVHRLADRRWWIRFACFALAGFALIVALMRPQWGLRFVQTPRMGAEMMICLDVSRSMLAEDAVPSRLERAKADISDLLGYLDGDHVGLIAFAGKATVLCPLTPDFGFYRLVLEGAGPQSVARGGTNVEAALRKAVAGFRTEADVSRIIVLITDGEDHDHFPLEAASEAADRGIRVLSIGFGSEAGSEIFVRDPESGARTLVRDRNDNPVRSRLDGDLLREIALKTGGAYIPAGTGNLDLRSIYGAHIAPLVRGRLDGRGRPMRNEGFQWCVLAAMLAIAGGALAGSGRARLLQRFREFGLAILLLALLPGVAWADEKKKDEDQPANDTAPADTTPIPEDAREAYNGGVQHLASDALDRAARAFESARSHAGTDGAVRFRSGYNLGWVEVRRADALLKSEPEKALEHLQRAAEWFRDAVRLRPERTDARTNLELILRRIRELADAIAKNDQRDVVKELDELIESQRALIAELGAATDALADSRDDPVARRAYRRLATAQRQRLSDARGLIEHIAGEQEALEAKPEKERQTEERIRAAQLASGRSYLQRATQRLGQARSQLRRRSIGRAFLRSASGLTELKRARDQFRNPVEILDALVGDGARVLTHAGQIVSMAERPPQWLTSDHVDEQRAGLRERTEELRARLAAGLEAPAPEPKEAEDPATIEKTKRMRETLKLAVPYLVTAVEQFDAAHPSLKARRPNDETQKALGSAVDAISKARELFLDLKRLVEVAYDVQRRLADWLGDDQRRGHALDDIASLQKDNSARGKRMERLLEDARRDAQPKPDPQKPEDPETAKQREAYWEEAARLRTAAAQLLDSAHASVSIAADDASAIDTAQASAADARDALDALRRHLFTLIERLRERLREQVDINDQTTSQLGKDEDDARKAALGALGERQDETRARSEAISVALKSQAEQAASQPGPQPGAAGQGQPSPAERYQKAAEHVDVATEAMQLGNNALKKEPLEPDPVRETQLKAAEELAKALASLQPPQQKNDQDQQQQQQQQQQGDQKQEEKQKPQKGGALQAVRDREAKRRAKKDKKGVAADGSVEKDW